MFWLKLLFAQVKISSDQKTTGNNRKIPVKDNKASRQCPQTYSNGQEMKWNKTYEKWLWNDLRTIIKEKETTGSHPKMNQRDFQ